MARMGKVLAALALVGVLTAPAWAESEQAQKRATVKAVAGGSCGSGSGTPCGSGNVRIEDDQDGTITIHGPAGTKEVNLSELLDLQGLKLLTEGKAPACGKCKHKAKATCPCKDRDNCQCKAKATCPCESKERSVTIEGPNGPINFTVPSITGIGGKGIAGHPNVRILDFNRSRPGKMEELTYLGVTTSLVTAELGKHLKLPRGVGLMVDHADPKGPAAKAGVKAGDILHKLDDQLLINMPQLAVLVRMNKPGTEVKLTLIQSGDRKTKTVKLAKKNMFTATGTITAPAVGRFPRPNVKLPPQSRISRFRLDGSPPKAGVSMAITMAMSDGKHRILVKPEDDGMRLTVKNKAGKVIHDELVPTDDDGGIDVDGIDGLSDDIKAKIRKMTKALRASRIRIRGMGGRGEDDQNSDNDDDE